MGAQGRRRLAAAISCVVAFGLRAAEDGRILDRLRPDAPVLLPAEETLHALLPGDFTDAPGLELVTLSRKRFERTETKTVRKDGETELSVREVQEETWYLRLWERRKGFAAVEAATRTYFGVCAWDVLDGPHGSQVLLLTPAGLLRLTLRDGVWQEERLAPAGPAADAHEPLDLPLVLRRDDNPAWLLLPTQAGFSIAAPDTPNAPMPLPDTAPFVLWRGGREGVVEEHLLPGRRVEQHAQEDALVLGGPERMAVARPGGHVVWSGEARTLLAGNARFMRIIDMDGDGGLDLAWSREPTLAEKSAAERRKEAKDKESATEGGWAPLQGGAGLGAATAWRLPGSAVFLDLDGRPGAEALTYRFDAGMFRLMRAFATGTLKVDLTLGRWRRTGSGFEPAAEVSFPVKVRFENLRSPLSLSAGRDFTGDGIPDLLWVTEEGKARLRPGLADTGLGAEEDARLSLPSGADLGQMQVRDLDGDDQPDLVVPIEREERHGAGFQVFFAGARP